MMEAATRGQDEAALSGQGVHHLEAFFFLVLIQSPPIEPIGRDAGDQGHPRAVGAFEIQKIHPLRFQREETEAAIDKLRQDKPHIPIRVPSWGDPG